MKPGVGQSVSRPVRQYLHSRHVFNRYGITRSPTLQPSTPGPVSVIVPTTSIPRTYGRFDREARDALADIHIEVVERAGLDPQRNLARAGLRVVDLLESKNVEPAEFVEPHRLHARDLPSAGRRECVMSDVRSRVKPEPHRATLRRRLTTGPHHPTPVGITHRPLRDPCDHRQQVFRRSMSARPTTDLTPGRMSDI